MRKVGLVLLVLFGVLAAITLRGRIWPGEAETDGRIVLDVSAGAAATRGLLRVSVYGDSGNEQNPSTQRTVYVNGPGYGGMEDNDLRGYLDGLYKYDWNQPGQSHVRTGRRAASPWHGEMELFRILHRWGDIELPAAAEVTNADIDFMVEYGPTFPVDVFLYEVKKDWNPGDGGIDRDNVSTRAAGEVWWLDATYLEKAWGLPGVGFASDTHPDADTGAMPLASAHYEPGDTDMHFSSPELTRYVAERVAAGKPLLFLLKQSDSHEDSPGTGLGLYSGNHGDIRNTNRRPRLSIEWRSPNEILRMERNVFLEHGRSLALAPIDIQGADFVSASFEPADGFEAPTVEVGGGGTADWRKLAGPLSVDGDVLQIRVRAGQDPIPVGSAFETALRDTWVISAPPEEQLVPFEFIAPSGHKHVVNAEYQGDFRWTIQFAPTEMGRWHYSWTQKFAERPFQSAVGVFDVVGGDLEGIKKSLAALLDRVRGSDLSVAGRQKEFGIEFARLERAAMQTQTPESYQAESGRELKRLFRELRLELAGDEGSGYPQ